MLGISFEQLRFILHGAGWTLLLSLIGFAGGALLGLPLALLRTAARLGRADGALIQLVQGIPLPVLMFLCYFGISIAGYDLPSLAAAGLAMTLYAAAFLAEIWKACIQAVSKTQWEAAECLALRPLQCVRHGAAASGAHRGGAHGGIPGADREELFLRGGDRLLRPDLLRARGEQLDLRTLRGVQHRGRPVLRHLLPLSVLSYRLGCAALGDRLEKIRRQIS